MSWSIEIFIFSADFFHVATARKAGLIKHRVLSWFMPGFSKTHEIKPLVQDVVMDEEGFIGKRLCIK